MAKKSLQGLRNRDSEVAEVDVPERLTLVQRLTQWRDRFKFGPHHRMERFTIMLSATLVFLLLFSSLSFAKDRGNLAQQVSTQARYTQSFVFSLSGQKMFIDGVFGDLDHKDVMVLFRLQDAKGMSVDASNYQLFITGLDKSMEAEAKTTLSMFGSTGYGIIRFQNSEGVPKRILDVTIRANEQLSTKEGTGSSGDKKNTDGSFAKYDQGRFYVNPGADNITKLDWLVPGENNPTKLYTALVAEAKDEIIREQIKSQTVEMANLLNRAKEYTNRLVSVGYEAPKTPWFIQGDYVDENGTFVAAKNLAGAHLIDYTTKTIRDGYIKQVMGGLSEFDGYMKKKTESTSTTAEKNQTRKEQVEQVTTLNNEDGSILDLRLVSTGTSPSSQVAAKDSAESLQQTWRSYLSIKQKVQRDLLRSLLVLDADVLSQELGFTQQQNDNGITYY
ncbi:hypothetical protein ASD24_24735 [Paenibacillus sp. Root52]|uniref:hypothetical protein n=1 Tax=Paenibacillus sp. Root52 TaxID=1736552 RepID=UPI0006F87813|nr:hypothetical protein [Paenibacillus sp. Root52]KQY91005.1 hypothetical protein ASD24_24735 [Paenibacillus sp. Root52]